VRGLAPGGLAPFVLKWCLIPFLALATAHAAPATIDFSDDFESHVAGQLPGAPWKEETYKSGAVIVVDQQHAFSGHQALHVRTCDLWREPLERLEKVVGWAAGLGR